jgi:hypothetical protein
MLLLDEAGVMQALTRSLLSAPAELDAGYARRCGPGVLWTDRLTSRAGQPPERPAGALCLTDAGCQLAPVPRLSKRLAGA